MRDGNLVQDHDSVRHTAVVAQPRPERIAVSDSSTKLTCIALAKQQLNSPLLFRRDTGTVHENNFPGSCLLLKKGRLKPILILRAGGIRYTALVGVGHPCGITIYVDVRVGHVPLVVFTRGVLNLDEVHDRVSIESSASIEDIEVWCDHGVEHRNIVGAGRNEYRANCVCNLRLLKREGALLCPRSGYVHKKH
jgi:hypothetical protein